VRTWQLWSTAAVLALLAFASYLLVVITVETGSVVDEMQLSRLAIAARVLLGIVAVTLAVGYRLRGSRDALITVGLVAGTLVGLLGLVVWLNWSVPIA
jgi:hypothetical protein